MATHYGRHLERLERGEPLEANALLALCERVKDLLVNEDNVVDVPSPVAVCGDLHGQFHDLLELFKLSGPAPETSYVFLGDFVDRGAMSVETISLLCVLKAKDPDRVTLLRGNHESRQTTQVYGFQIECLKKYDGDARIYKAFMDLFDFLPLGALIDKRLLCLHGGLSPALHHLDQLRMLHRFQEIPPDGIFADIVWSDPDAKTRGFHMSPRGAGYIFGEDVVEKFLHTNKLMHMARAHQLCMEGFQVLFRETFSTVWSAPNYCHRFGNLAAVMAVDDHLERTYKTFKEAASSRNIGVLDNKGTTSSDAIDAGYFT
uniref:Serine/threonine-protein phosphatase n=1 Tax=Hyaloperonospora arabidopsidis (strain Emoy2) TaxID=559515 RepID=M4C5P3_HYAAE